MSERRAPEAGPRTIDNANLANRSSSNVISMVGDLAGRRLYRPNEAALPWTLRRAAHGVSAQLDLPYGDALRSVCAGYLRAAS
jgi:hypothetical protein